MKRKLLLLTLAFVLVISGCSTSDNPSGMYLKSANPSPDSYWVDKNKEKIKLSFNEKIEKQNIVIKENGKELKEYNVEINYDTINISGLNLNKRDEYTISYNVKSKKREVNGNYNFYTSPKLPDIRKQNETYMQAFYWNMGNDDNPKEQDLWQLLGERSNEFKKIGVTSLILPPAHKGSNGINDNGYTNYDMWDLGEFDQKGSKRTKWGTKNQLEEAISVLDMNEIDVIYDATLNKKMGANETESVILSSNSKDKAGETITAKTNFNNMLGRNNYYTASNFPNLYKDFQWDKNSFDGVNYNVDTDKEGEFLFENKNWGHTLSNEEKDLTKGADIDYYNYDKTDEPIPNNNVINETKAWGKWITEKIGFSGFRINNIKYIDTNFLINWFNYLKEQNEETVFLSEIENETNKMIDILKTLNSYTNKNIGDLLKIYDFSTRKKLSQMDDSGFDMSKLKNSILKTELENANINDNRLLFVESANTIRKNNEFAQQIELKEQAYAYILTKEKGTPMIFWKDYYQSNIKEKLNKLLLARRYYAYGKGRNAKINDDDVYGYVREGNDTKGTGLVTLIANGYSREIVSKKINSARPNTTYVDLMNNVQGTVKTDENGAGNFQVYNDREKGVSVWIPVKWEEWKISN